MRLMDAHYCEDLYKGAPRMYVWFRQDKGYEIGMNAYTVKEWAYGRFHQAHVPRNDIKITCCTHSLLPIRIEHNNF